MLKIDVFHHSSFKEWEKEEKKLHRKKDGYIGKGGEWVSESDEESEEMYCTVQWYAGGECGPWNIYETSGQFFNKANLLSLILWVSVCIWRCVDDDV